MQRQLLEMVQMELRFLVLKNINIDINEYQDAGHIWIIDKDSDEEIVKKGYEDLINKIN